MNISSKENLVKQICEDVKFQKMFFKMKIDRVMKFNQKFIQNTEKIDFQIEELG